jgi:uncharacterized DUF497 family protein
MFEWDEAKRATNLVKHNLDFLDVDLLFDGRPSVTASSVYPSEERHVTTAPIDGKYYTVIWT